MSKIIDLDINVRIIYVRAYCEELNFSVYLINTPIEFTKSTQLLGVHTCISNDITIKIITSSVHKYYARVNSVLYDLGNVPCHVKAKLLSTYCLDLYGSQLWNFSSIEVQSFFVAWRKSIRRLMEIANHYSLLQLIIVPH